MKRNLYLQAGCSRKLRFVPVIAISIVLIFGAQARAIASDIRYMTISAPDHIVRVRAVAGRIIVEGKSGGSHELSGLVDTPVFRLLENQPPFQSPNDGLPDGEITNSADGNLTAWLTGPTRRYDHGVLGDDIEASGFRLRDRQGNEFNYQLTGDQVFEDRRIRFWDIDGDGKEELVVIQSGFDGGARIAVFGKFGDGIKPVASSDAIGRAYRWLNLIAVADFDGDGSQEIAAVITPHLGVVLRLFRPAGSKLVPVYEAHGFSNHGIGMRSMQLATVLDANADGIPDLVVPDASRTSIRIVTFAGGRFRELNKFFLNTSISGDMAIIREATSSRAVFPLSNGMLGIILINHK
jgi:hypothetical protein